MNNSVWYSLLAVVTGEERVSPAGWSGLGALQRAIHANKQLPVKNQYVVRLNKE